MYSATLLDGQVAGHGGLLCDASLARVYKPLSGPRGVAEAAFYARVCRDPATPPASLMPRYFGTSAPHADTAPGADAPLFLVLEDLTAGCRRPCVLDLKVGVQSWDEGAPPAKVAAERGKWLPQSQLGFRMTGMRAWRAAVDAECGGRWLEHGRAHAYALTAEGVPAALAEFVAAASGEGVRLDVVARFLVRLREVRAHFAVQSAHRFYGSSLLFVFDGDSSGNGGVADVRMIDFAHVWPIADGGRDAGYLRGVDSIIAAFEAVVQRAGAYAPGSSDGWAAYLAALPLGEPEAARSPGGAAAASDALAAPVSSCAGALNAAKPAAPLFAVPPSATITSLEHVPFATWQSVYEPAEDTWLLCDALASHLGRITADGCPGLVVELGCVACVGCFCCHHPAPVTHPSLRRSGSGYVSTHLLQLLQPHVETSGGAGAAAALPACACIACDINPAACLATLGTAAANGVGARADALQCDLLASLRSRLAGSVDVFLFNPPYVPTPRAEVPAAGAFAALGAGADVGSAGGALSVLAAAWAGGERGRLVIDRAVPLVAQLLRRPTQEQPRGGVAFWVLVEENRPLEVLAALRGTGVAAAIVASTRAQNERLHIVLAQWPQS